MLSVLIPVYNYDIRELVNTIHKQLLASQVPFEIICIDDASEKQKTTINSEMGKLSHTTYTISESNFGRVATRQTLAIQATYDWLLFLDADVLPKSDDFIQNYLNHLNSDYDAIYGGFAYKKERPTADFILRWTYGKSKEEVPASQRNQTPYKIVISANFLIKKQLFLDINSRITQKGYGYDNYFGALLKEKKAKIFHLDNEVFHLGLEPNASYLNKVEQSIDTLIQLDNKGELRATDNSLFKTFKTLKTWKLNRVASWMYKVFKKQWTRNLLSAHPSVFILQCYKLSYICYQDLNS